MTPHLARRRTAAAILTGAALLAGGLVLSLNSGADPLSVADSSWGGIVPASPSPSPSPIETPIAAANDSSWGG
ncbi:hypothetical protein [Kitasatospora cheerisanensis]|uniref:Uncharacterized protein n=1 Tax=Kitasatospora cheerisanensis KCTC 2395 TaxID=1348663 RepID=A0A066YZI2_9ACTN|nr:hypothetical protein [Kitasatospora cheerisanensis]KDN83496.1 hypothetical protein KCH_49780 [Kitasatospora cheerisanensis KCTC 2395]